MKSVQITGYLPSEDAIAFQEYAVSLGIDKSSLANLLIRRELRQGRLGSLDAYRHSVPRAECVKVTAHLADEETKLAFASAAERLNIVPGIAASMIYRAELSERWLEQAIFH